MPWTTPLPILLWALIALPVTIWLWVKPPDNKITLLAAALGYFLFNLVCFLAINWAIINYYLRFLAASAAIVMLVRLLRHIRPLPWFPQKTLVQRGLAGFWLVVLLLMLFTSVRVCLSLIRPPGVQPVLLLFPMRNGLYVVTNGGNGEWGWGMNSWPGAESQANSAYGIDIMKMKIRGYLAKTLLSNNYLDYEGLLDTVISPCRGEVVYVEDGHPMVPVLSQQGTPLGNYVVIRCYEFYVTLGNLRADSITVTVGDIVSPEDILGYLGNAGSPAIPSLHIHTTTGGWKDGEGTPVPMLFDGPFSIDRFAVRNDLYLFGSAPSSRGGVGP